MLVSACENGSSPDEDSLGDKTGQASTSQTQSDSLNHRAFKTVSLFKSSGVLSIFELINQSFTTLLVTTGKARTEQAVCQEMRLLTDVLKLHKLKLNHGRNQMQFKITLKESAKATEQKIS